MVIKFTVRDNDYWRVMDSFSNLFSSALARELPNEESDRVFKLLNPNLTKSYTEEDKTFLITEIKKMFKNFVESRVDAEASEYLTDNFEVEIITSVEDKWENDEMYYWFQHSDTVINQ